MKKNVMMRLASFLLVAVLISTSAISGTYAKYVTSASGSDTARVAKFGVEVAVAGGLFAQNYVRADDNNPGSADLTVASSNSDDLVAPGTQNDEGITFSITGTPEVNVLVDISIDDASRKDVYLVAGDYLDYTTGASMVEGEDGEDETVDTFTLANNYHPLLFTLADGTGNPIAGLKDVNILTIEDYLENTLSKEYPANTDLATELAKDATGQFRLTWRWAFENGLDEADTLLGNVAAGTATLADGTYNLQAHIELSVSVTQVD